MTKPDHITSLKEQLADLRAAKKEYSTIETLKHGHEVVDPEPFLVSLIGDIESTESDDVNKSEKLLDDYEKLKVVSRRILLGVILTAIIFVIGYLSK